VNGVEPQSETVWRQADRYKVPRICFINKMDKLGADFDFSFQSLFDRLAAPAVAVQYPIGKADTFEGIIDLVLMKAYYFSKEDRGVTITEKEIPAEWADKAAELRETLIERAAECDGALPAFAPDAVTATEVMVAVTAMLKAVNLQVFELGMWQAWSGR